MAMKYLPLYVHPCHLEYNNILTRTMYCIAHFNNLNSENGKAHLRQYLSMKKISFLTDLSSFL